MGSRFSRGRLLPGLGDELDICRNLSKRLLLIQELERRKGHRPENAFHTQVIAESLNPALPADTTVAAVMGEMGREFDGGYAEYALLPDDLLIPVSAGLDWPVLGALPETYLTAWGAMQAFGIPGHGRPSDGLVYRGECGKQGRSHMPPPAASAAARGPRSSRRETGPLTCTFIRWAILVSNQ